MRKIRLLNEQGRLIASFHREGDDTTISLRDLPAGIYLLELIDHQGTSIESRVVKK